MDCCKTHNQCVNTIMFPGVMAQSSYGATSYDGSRSHLRTIYIPWESDCYTSSISCAATSSMIPAILAVNHSNRGKMFCIHFHGNACDIGQVAVCANRESSALHAHYLLVEYPGFGMANGHSSELTINQMAQSVYSFVVNELQVPSDRIVLIGRSIGTGPVCHLASALQRRGTPPLAVVLHSPYASIRDAASDLLGCLSFCMFDRWPNWARLIGDPAQDPSVIRAPVLFLHADGDKVINYHHSLLLHQHRAQAGLLSELFVQRSNDVYIKGHNYFDYENDVVVPTRVFLHKILATALVGAGAGPGTGAGTAVRTDIGSALTLFLPVEVIKRAVAVPVEYLRYTEEFVMRADEEKPSKLTPQAYCHWACCPCVFCAEGCLALVSNSVRQCLPSRAFNYQKLRPEEATMGGLLNVLSRRKSFDRVVNEEEAARSMQRAAATQRQKQAFERSAVENPMLVSAAEDVRSRSSGGAAPRTTVPAAPTTSFGGNAPVASLEMVRDEESSSSEKMAFPAAVVSPMNLVRGTSTDGRDKLNYVPG